jgi:predicted RNA methylase
MGAFYVPTSNKIIDEILKNAGLKKGQLFFDLGSGDGRVVRAAVKKYQVRGVGIEINPLLILVSWILAKMEKLNNIEFRRENLFATDIKNADVIFVFLMPETLKSLKSKIINECQKEVLFISHGFVVEGWEKYLQKKISRRDFSTYYYRLKFFRQT